MGVDATRHDGRGVSAQAVVFDAQGLVPCVVQDARTGEVLTVAYMNVEALEQTRATGETHFFSRSRGEIWHKGETSGNIQRVRALRLDCDGDALVALVDPAGPACHTGERTCFHRGEAGRAGPALRALVVRGVRPRTTLRLDRGVLTVGGKPREYADPYRARGRGARALSAGALARRRAAVRGRSSRPVRLRPRAPRRACGGERNPDELALPDPGARHLRRPARLRPLHPRGHGDRQRLRRGR